ncbi:MAG: SAM-dependent methyltransferase [Burkholderiales bacterium]|uniref:SAM-dependent methyltransferase n=1 Tax=Limnobacter sp. TaxID=2003368 RepID=UPI0039BC35C0|nr:SAM-dependent methyltransferase [Burkholderiales bacterium]
MLIEEMMPVEKSKVWELLETLYQQEGPDAWKNGLVPQGSTSNCYIADTYAAIVAGFIQDLEKNGSAVEPLVIELGGGNGKFAWQFMQRMVRYHRTPNEKSPGFQYLLTDASESNIAAWKENSRLKLFADRGWIQFAHLRIDEQSKIKIDNSVLDPKALSNRPVVIIANYLFDTLPCDMYGIKDGQLHQILISLEEDKVSADRKSFTSLKPTYEWKAISKANTGSEQLDSIVQSYTQETHTCVVPVPRLGFKFLQQFTEREQPLLMLAGDMAFTDPSQFPAHPPLIFDTYFAHYTNFHVFRELFKKQGGGMRAQRHHDPDFCTAAFFMPGTSGKAEHFSATLDAAKSHLSEFSPYDAHEMNDLLKLGVHEPSYRQIFSWLRLSRFDPDVALECIHPLLEAIHRSDEGLNKQMLCDSYLEAYALYFPGTSDTTFDYATAQLLLAIGMNHHALALLESSIAEFGRKPERLYVYALALLRLKQNDKAKNVLEEVLSQDPPLVPAMRVYEENFGAKNKAAPTEEKKNSLSVSISDPEVEKKAKALLDVEGAVLFEGMFPKALIDKTRETFLAHFEDLKKSEMGQPNFVGNKRYTFPVRVVEPFNNPSLFANETMVKVLEESMGQRPIINAYGAVVTYPGANSQHVHREHPLLFTKDEHNCMLPNYAVTVLIPLVDLNPTLGGTQLWPRTHTTGLDASQEGPATVLYAQKGDALMFDYRTFHGGMPCLAGELRVVLFITYSVPWFRDTLAFESHDALALSKDELECIPAQYRDLFRFARKK